MDEPRYDKKLKSLTVRGDIGKNKVQIILPETFMNKSGESLKPLALSAKKSGKFDCCS